MLGWRSDIRAHKTLLEVMQLLSYDAVGLGDNDFVEGARFLNDEMRRRGLPVTTANVRSLPAEESSPYPPFRIVGRGGLRIGIIGLATSQSFRFMSPRRLSEVRTVDQTQALRRILPEVRGQADLIVLLHHADLDASKDIARAFSDIDLIVGSHDRSVHEVPVQEGRTLIVHTGRNGAYAGRLTLTWDKDRIDQYENQLIPLTDEIADEPAVKKVIETYYAALQQTAEQTAALRSNRPFQGVETCVPCHEDAYNQWRETPHARAFQTLVETEEEEQPECLRCHTTGFGQPGGYLNLETTDRLKDVQCEVCHRMSAAHLQQPQKMQEPVEKVSERLCMTCHTPAQSPDFHYEEAIEKVRH